MGARLGFIGLGLMGQPIVTNLLAAGHEVAVFDVRPGAADALVERGATRCDSSREVAAASEVVFTSLPGPQQMRAAALGPDGIGEGLAPGGIYIDLSTNSPIVVREVAAELADRGLHVLDAPLGGRSGLAATRDLQVMAGGDPDVFERARPVLDVIGKRVSYCGPLGSGMVCKLMHNAINAVFRQSAAECFTAGVKAGVDADVLWDVVRNGITCAGSEINKTMRNTWLSGNFDTGTGFLKMHYKDTVLAADVGRELAVPMPQVDLAISRLEQAMERGWGDRDATVSILIQEELAGVDVRITD